MSGTPAAPDSAPIESFAQCHVGIVSHLQELARLPALLEPARQARQIASEMLSFFRSVVFEHHAEEERELFPAVLSSAHKGEERDKVQLIVERGASTAIHAFRAAHFELTDYEPHPGLRIPVSP